MLPERTLSWCSKCFGEIWSDEDRFIAGQGPDEGDTSYLCLDCVTHLYVQALAAGDKRAIAHYEQARRHSSSSGSDWGVPETSLQFDETDGRAKSAQGGSRKY